MLRACFHLSNSLTLQVHIVCVFFVFIANVSVSISFERLYFRFYIISVSKITIVSVNVGSVIICRTNSWLLTELDVCSADGKYEVSYKPNVVIYNDGRILWIPIAIYQSSCVINVKYFPFDEQECQMEFGSWTFNADQVTLGWYEEEPKVRLSVCVSHVT